VHHFKGSFIVTLVGLVWALFIGGMTALYIVTILAILEISLSFDNAVVNAKVLESMEKKWQDRFVTYGIPVAVFGMRFLFPIVIVAIASGMGVWQTFNVALDNPEAYNNILDSVKSLIYAFGGAFLLMVFLNFILDDEREEHWIGLIEESETLHKIAAFPFAAMIIAVLTGVLISVIARDIEITIAYTIGIILYLMIHSLDKLLHVDGIRSGLMGLLYLEILDASFSFDGVIGAFALSSNIFLIMIGLGIGAMFVRSLTLFMLEKKTLTIYRYLEHGAHYAIFVLALIMFIKIFNDHISELLVGTVGVGFILTSAYYSIRANQQEAMVSP